MRSTGRDNLGLGFDSCQRQMFAKWPRAIYTRDVVCTCARRLDKPNTLDAIRDVIFKPSREANTPAALALAIDDVFTLSRGDRPRRDNVIVLISGSQSGDGLRTVAEARRAHAADIRVTTVGVSRYVNEEEMREVSSPPHEWKR